jgi:tetratricopeptide (TPR) repeat protein
VKYLQGRVATSDGTPVPNDALVERVCDNNVRQQVHATFRGEFTMDLGETATSFVDASGDPGSPYGLARKAPYMGISRRELAKCELRAAVPGFHPAVISLVEHLADFGGSGSLDVGPIVVQRAVKIEGMTLSATAYKAPKDARKAYEKGLDSENHGKLAKARQHFEKAVQIYPGYASAWFQLGIVLEKEKQKDAARVAYTHATTIDAKFLPPYLSLASLAFDAQNWPEVLRLTGHILDHDPLNHTNVTGYILDLDPINCTAAYYYNAVANYKLKRIDAAEKSAIKAEHVDLRTRFPQLHLLLAEIFEQKHNYAGAMSEVQTYLELVPHSSDADQLRARVAKLEKLNGSLSTSEKPSQP